MEANLAKLEQQEQKYTDELTAALVEYEELKDKALLGPRKTKIVDGRGDTLLLFSKDRIYRMHLLKKLCVILAEVWKNAVKYDTINQLLRAISYEPAEEGCHGKEYCRDRYQDDAH